MSRKVNQSNIMAIMIMMRIFRVPRQEKTLVIKVKMNFKDNNK